MDTGRGAGTKRNHTAHGLLTIVHRLHRLANRLLDTLTMQQQRHASRGGLYPASGTFDKPRLQKLLKLAHLQADGGLRNTQHIGRRRKAAALNH